MPEYGQLNGTKKFNEECVDAVRKSGGRFMIYGTGSKAGDPIGNKPMRILVQKDGRKVPTSFIHLVRGPSNPGVAGKLPQWLHG